MIHFMNTLIVLSAYCVLICFIVAVVAKRTSRKIRQSGVVGKMLVGDIDKGHGVPVSEEGPLMAKVSKSYSRAVIVLTTSL
ncbi:MAG: hypothetical protein ACLQF0_06950 [Dissulfurispiraceae bacterium]